jgi:hypothetical protein
MPVGVRGTPHTPRAAQNCPVGTTTSLNVDHCDPRGKVTNGWHIFYISGAETKVQARGKRRADL